MIGSMHLGMTIQATLGKQIEIWPARGKTGAIMELTGMEIDHVALLAQKWRTTHQQRRLCGTVGLVALTAIFCRRWVFKYKGSTFLFMAGEAGFNQAGFNQICSCAATVWVVTI